MPSSLRWAGTGFNRTPVPLCCLLFDCRPERCETFIFVNRYYSNIPLRLCLCRDKVAVTLLPQSLTWRQRSTCRCPKVTSTKRKRLSKMSHCMTWMLPMPDLRYVTANCCLLISVQLFTAYKTYCQVDAPAPIFCKELFTICSPESIKLYLILLYSISGRSGHSLHDGTADEAQKDRNHR